MVCLGPSHLAGSSSAWRWFLLLQRMSYFPEAACDVCHWHIQLTCYPLPESYVVTSLYYLWFFLPCWKDKRLWLCLKVRYHGRSPSISILSWTSNPTQQWGNSVFLIFLVEWAGRNHSTVPELAVETRTVLSASVGASKYCRCHAVQKSSAHFWTLHTSVWLLEMWAALDGSQKGHQRSVRCSSSGLLSMS